MMNDEINTSRQGANQALGASDSASIPEAIIKASGSILTVGDGRGFVVNCRHDRLVITAAHCLPFFPPCHGASDLEERTYGALLGPLHSEPSVCAECLFADPIADIAVLGSPDNQALFDQADAYEALMESAEPFPITDAPEEGQGWMYSLSGEWFRCTVKYLKHVDGPLIVCDTEQPIKAGMSGSPIISEHGAAIGVLNLSSNPGGLIPGIADRCEDQYGVANARLVRDLPGWLLRDYPGQLRDLFWKAIDAYRDWQTGEPEPICLIHYQEPISRACALLCDCNDILPESAVVIFGLLGLEIKGRTYAAAARGLLDAIKQELLKE